jgi:orotidine-5'-phosphate decarboxylase
MNPADRLIVALDVPAPEAGAIFSQLHRELGLTRFKLGAATLLESSGRTLVHNMLRDGARLMLDLKVYDVPSTVERVVRAAYAMGAELLTVHVDSVRAAVDSAHRPKILAVGALTTTTVPMEHSGLDGYVGYLADGIVCHPLHAGWLREANPGKLIVCPGIRPVDHTGDYLPRDDHASPSSPTQAIRNGADLLVVGRPITGADDPVAAARGIVEEISSATQNF